ncbi:MAG: DUF58 domain-containing protein, partial [Acidobacteriota bacterium]|nr:DUF58 domain-containing protein [Acidobacteriota bacterium]
RPLRVAARRHDLIAVRVTDVREHRVPDVGLIDLEDAESGVPVRLDTSDARVRQAFRDRALKARAAASRALRETGVDVVEVTAGEPYDAPLRKFFRMRQKRRR